MNNINRFLNTNFVGVGMKLLKNFLRCSLFIFVFFMALTLVFVPFREINNLPENVSITMDAIDEINQSKMFGKFVSLNYNQTVKAGTKEEEQLIKVKLFNMLTIKTLKVGLNSKQVYVGGNTVGFSLNSKGVILIGNMDIQTKDGKVNTLNDSKLENGDVILKIGEYEIEKIADINKVTENYSQEMGELKVVANRNGEEYETTIMPALDIYTNTYKLGIWVKDETSGVGTLTYINKEDGSFGALGHSISDNDTKTAINVTSGGMYPCTVLGLKKGEKGKPGEVRALFLPKNKIGEVQKNSNYGIFGTIDNLEEVANGKQLLSTGGRLTARPGKAKIRSDLSGTIKDYDIEIIKTNYQHSSSEKSMVIKVCDSELIELTGGIIQGMSGCPIIQNDRVIGAITHVYVNDPLKGFGIYLDWMIEWFCKILSDYKNIEKIIYKYFTKIKNNVKIWKIKREEGLNIWSVMLLRYFILTKTLKGLSS